LAAAEIFVLPSYSENFGIAAAEAFAAGKACVLSNQVGLAQDARRANAAIVTPCDAGELSGAIKKLLADRAQQFALGQAARQFARDYLSLGAVGRQLEEEYRKYKVQSRK
jgi:glycosyltransferase involved in cell wall biosynthesis